MGNVARIVIVEDETLVTSLLEKCFGKMRSLLVVGSAQCGVSGLELCLKCKPDLVLLDLEMPGLSGLEVARQLRSQLPETRIIVVSSHCNAYTVHEINRLRIHGFVDKCSSLDLLCDIIDVVLSGKNAFCPAFDAVSKELGRHAEAYQKILSSREIAVLIAVVEGRNDTDIAGQLDIAPRTVISHRRNIRRKLNVHNNRDLTHYARQWGLVPLTLKESVDSNL